MTLKVENAHFCKCYGVPRLSFEKKCRFLYDNINDSGFAHLTLSYLSEMNYMLVNNIFIHLLQEWPLVAMLSTATGN